MNSSEPQLHGSKKGISLRRAERILKVQERFDQGAKTSEIAQIYGISQRMVQKDLKAAPHLNRELVLSLDQGELLGRKIRFLESLMRYAMRQCQLSRNENAQVGWARLAKEALEMLIKVCQSTGLITTVPTRVSLEEGNPFSDAEFRKEYAALMKKARERGIKIDGL